VTNAFYGHLFSGELESAHPQGHPAHLFFFLSLYILRITAATITSKINPVRIVPILTAPPAQQHKQKSRRQKKRRDCSGSKMPCKQHSELIDAKRHDIG
jgi:hypothetical protein